MFPVPNIALRMDKIRVLEYETWKTQERNQNQEDWLLRLTGRDCVDVFNNKSQVKIQVSQYGSSSGKKYF